MLKSDSKFILIVDDNPTNLFILSHALKTAGYKVRMAANGQQAISQVTHTPAELILLDVQMPVMDGFETCQRLQADPLTQNIPVIFMTASSDAESKIKGLSLGAVDYITKPFEQEEVLARVKIHWRLKQLTDNLEQEVIDRTNALQQAQVQLVQQEKLSALGELVAGVAHEINNPISFVANNIAPAQEYLSEISQLLALYQQHYPQPTPDIAKKIDAMDLKYVLDDFANILDSMRLGTDRIEDISTSLRNFTRSDIDVPIAYNLHQGLESTLLLLKHRLKNQKHRPAIEVIKNYGDLPHVTCFPGQMNQVFMNILANAIDALEEAWEKDQRSLIIQITTQSDSNIVIIKISDNALGMTEEVMQKIFQPLFTTKTLGKGTGLGLSISKQIVEDKHQGKMHCHSIVGKGTEFIIEISL